MSKRCEMDKVTTYIIYFSGLNVRITVNGNNYHTATARFHLYADDGRPDLYNDVTVPVSRLFDLVYLIELSVRKLALQYKLDLVEMQDRINQIEHLSKNIGGESGKEDKEKS